MFSYKYLTDRKKLAHIFYLIEHSRNKLYYETPIPKANNLNTLKGYYGVTIGAAELVSCNETR